ncbi:ribonuclease R [Alkalilimnicola sp. S0819]|uniref:ribonuclease R n=1 Tax=Alkalilimnicola sp. S0819 TaxID=2613922 RepID=UPI00126225E5|nr:ribonuclease R [Alkalilimnicola sp. S0819]KAB7628360.1 ribonuclease R [Alkalilimnicola sp. S0819]MPQ15261.1 ribonuclease R [Alkalilimnicola sp. S0819]
MAKRDKTPRVQDPFRAREQQTYEHPIPSREYILEYLATQGRPLTREAIGQGLELEHPDAIEGLRRRLRAMEREGQLIRNRRRAYVIVDNKELVRGRINGRADGSGQMMPETGEAPIQLQPRQMRELFHGDRVVVRVTGIDAEGKPEGELVEVLKRANRSITGRFYRESGVGFVVPESKRIHHDVIVPADAQADAESGELVVAELVAQPSVRRQPIGRIIQVLGRHVEAGMEIQVAARVHGIPVDWPDDVLEAAKRLDPEVPDQAKEGRVDLRDTPLVTIDGADARDFDDAVYCEPTPSGWKLLVAIADVSHYVQPRKPLDREANERGTSVYFPRNVVPMLPEVLSNGLCSLNPQVDRLCMVAEMQIAADGKLRRSRFYRAVMRSHARLTYEEVAAMLEGDKALRRKHQGLIPHLEHLQGVFKSLFSARKRRGAIDFETSESQIIFGEGGRVETIVPTDRNQAHRIIEECMVIANVAAARFLQRHRIGGLFRDHEGPSADRLENLKTFLAQAGLSLGGGDKPGSDDYAKLMEQVRDRPDRHLIQTIMLRSMKAAEYRPESKGHFGLALEQYAHFTSPIRRYPDLIVHRAIGHILDGGKGKDFVYSHDKLLALGEHCSMVERRADEATRDAIMSLKCEYMADRVGEEFTGVISGVTGFGLFVELDELHVDGLVHISSLENDFYRFDPIGHRLQGERGGKEYRLTDRVRVRLARVDKDERKIDFDLLAHPLNEHGEEVGGKRKDKARAKTHKAAKAEAGDKPARRGRGSRARKSGR